MCRRQTLPRPVCTWPSTSSTRLQTYLERVANTARDKQLRPVARLRLARVQAAQGQYDKALATLGTADAGDAPGRIS